MAKYLDKSKEKWDELVDQWHSDSSLTCSLQEYLELDDIEYLKFAHGIDDPDISDTEVLEKSAGITRDVVTELVIKPALKKAIQVLNPDVPGTNSWGCEKRIVPKKERPRVYNELKVFLSVIINLQ